ncbi:hypothetical protein DPMN_163812 [Dreissena polymorpha]|nr:hypothetical protein DPMN_163812 [Dreissena polymorpha]
MHGAIERVSRAGIATSRPVRTKTGNQFEIVPIHSKTGSEYRFLVRLFEYVPGEVLEDKPYTAPLCYQVGRLGGRLDNALLDYRPPELMGHSRHWNLRLAGSIADQTYVIKDAGRRTLILEVVRKFQTNVLDRGELLRRGTIHGDLNEGNIIVRKENLNHPDTCGDSCTNETYVVHGILDFGDLVYEYHVFEVAIAITYIMIETKHGIDPVDAGGHVLAGYLGECPLPAEDLRVVKDCVTARLAQSLTYGAMAHHKDPSNTYCLRTSVRGWPLLKELWDMPESELYKRWNRTLKTYGIDAIKNLL